MNNLTGFSITLVLLCGTAVSCGRGRNVNREGERGRIEVPRPERTANVQSYAQVVDQVASSVLTIRSSRRVRQPRQFPFHNDPFFERFFGRGIPGGPGGGGQLQRGLGSGVIVRDDGHCVTNHHVIDGAEDIRVEFADGTNYRAKLVGSSSSERSCGSKILGF